MKVDERGLIDPKVFFNLPGLGSTYKKLLKMAIEIIFIVSFPIKTCDFPYVTLVYQRVLNKQLLEEDMSIFGNTPKTTLGGNLD